MKYRRYGHLGGSPVASSQQSLQLRRIVDTIRSGRARLEKEIGMFDEAMSRRSMEHEVRSKASYQAENQEHRG